MRLFNKASIKNANYFPTGKKLTKNRNYFPIGKKLTQNNTKKNKKQ